LKNTLKRVLPCWPYALVAAIVVTIALLCSNFGTPT
jgi:hypothetical protein